MKIRQQRIEHCKGQCEYCGAGGVLEMHHVFGGRLRKKLESLETVVMLCPECHRGTNSHETIKHFRIKVTAQLVEKYGENTAREKTGGKLYF